MRASEFVQHLEKVQSKGEGKWMACCPAHDDNDPSLSIAEHQDRILLKCWAGCDALSIVHSLGFELKDLFHEQHDYTPPHAFAQKEMREKKEKREKIERGISFLQIATASLKRGERMTDSDLAKCRRIKQYLAQEGVL